MPDQPRVLESLPEHQPHREESTNHRLRVEGLVRKPLELAGRDLDRLPRVTLAEDFACDEGWTAPEQRWSGVSVEDLLAAAEVAGDGAYVEFAAGDFRFTIPLEEAKHALVAVQLNDRPLSHLHGGPSRLVVPGAACFTSIKWLDRILVRDTPGVNTAEAIARARLAVQET
ncbi:MAG: molybdopterin-dependent oxidoreductase [Dehalococcoidia bacterium]